MSNQSETPRKSDDLFADTPHTDTTHKSKTQPWVSYLAIVACVGIFLGLVWRNDYESWNTLSMFGYLPPNSIWNGGYWGLVTSAFVHIALWHMAFNVYWLWVLGSRLERAIGSGPYLGFFIVSAFVSSSLQLAVSDDTGIGASGVVYAIFGFMWLTRDRYSQFTEVLDAKTIQLFIFWLIGCVVATFLKIWEVGNAAHIAGLLFGAAVACAFVLRVQPRVVFAGLILLVVSAIVPLFWCPWSVTWLGLKAYSAHAAAKYDVAIDRYTQIIRLDPQNAWAYLNRSSVYRTLGEPDRAQADLQRARELDPSIEKSK
jgi:rhomboid protease GluP